MILKMTLPEAISGYWDGGKKKIFNWEIERIFKPSDTAFERVGSFEANHWFWVRKGKSDRATLANARRSLVSKFKQASFELID